MAKDVKAIAEEVVTKLQKDPALLKKFQDDPIKVLESLSGLDLPDDQLQPVVTAIKAKLTADAAGNVLGGLFGKK